MIPPLRHTSRLTMRPWAAQDRSALDALLGDAQVMAFSDNGPLAAAGIDSWLAAQMDPGVPGWCWALARHGPALGYLSFAPTDLPDADWEIGIRLTRAARGQGLAQEAARAALTHLQEAHPQTTVAASVDPDNQRSRALFERLDFIRARPLWRPGYDHPDDLYLWTADASSRAGK